MADISIVNAIEQYESEALRGSDLAADRAKAMDYYLGRPLGNEITGRSQVVSHDVSDSIEWLKPGIIKTFTAGDEVIAFTPRNAEDVAGAQQESDYVNYIITQKNNWFPICYTWVTDALLQKNGYVKVYWDDQTTTEEEKYEGKTDDEFALVLQDPEVEVKTLQKRVVEYRGPQPYAITLNDFTVERKRTYGCARMLNIPPERTVISAAHAAVDLEESPFTEHWEYKTLSDLRKEGFDVDDDLGDESESPSQDAEDQARDRYNESLMRDEEDADPSMKRVKVRECWIRFDEDEDGVAELRHVIVVGSTVLLNEETDLVPVACLTPRIMPHRHIGISEADMTMDIQNIKTALQRGLLDNVYLSINGRNAVDKNKVNLNDMLTSRPGGIVRTDGPPGALIQPLVHSADTAGVLQSIQYFDGVREGRTGSSKNTQQLSEDVLSKMPSGIAVERLQSAQQAIQELIIRLFAETGIKSVFRLVHAFTLKHAKQQEMVRLRNQWVAVDPRQWKTRSDMTISVGLGAGDKQQQLSHLMPLANLQMQLQPTGLTDIQTLHNTLTKLTNAMGFKDSASFWKDPTQIPPKPPAPNPEVVKQMAINQAKKEQIMLKHQTDMAKLQAEMQAEMAKNASQAEQTRIEQMYREKAAILDAHLQAALKELDAHHEARSDVLNAKLDHDSKMAQAGFTHAAGKERDRLAAVK